MYIGHETRVFEHQAPLFVQILLVHRDLNDLCDKQVVGPKLLDRGHEALQADRTLPDGGCADTAGGNPGQMQVFKLVHIPAGPDSAEIRCVCQLFRSEIDDKFPGPGDDIVRVPLRTDGHGDHHRITADRAGPGRCHNIAPPLFIRAADHYSRDWI